MRSGSVAVVALVSALSACAREGEEPPEVEQVRSRGLACDEGSFAFEIAPGQRGGVLEAKGRATPPNEGAPTVYDCRPGVGGATIVYCVNRAEPERPLFVMREGDRIVLQLSSSPDSLIRVPCTLPPGSSAGTAPRPAR